MPIYRMFFCVLILSACSTQDFFDQELNIPPREETGFSRKTLFPNYLASSYFGNFGAQSSHILTIRNDWTPQQANFKSLYPSFNIHLLAFNHFGGDNNFSWQERLIISDAIELIVFVINHPLFEEEMNKKTFYNNERTRVIPSAQIVREIRDSSFHFTLNKDTLEKNVLALATIGGSSHSIWLRNDTDYQESSVLFLAVVLGHELTHNIGFLHSSNVPEGIQSPIVNIIQRASFEEALNFRNNTPYYEQDFLIKVRNYPNSRSRVKDSVIHKDYKNDFGFL